MARILCVDDDPGTVSLKRYILERAGHQVVPSHTVPDALEKLGSASFDAVVTDWRVGPVTGHAVLEAAKLRARVPVVVVSGFMAEAFQASEPRADLYLEKPVDPEELVQIINALLRNTFGGGTRSERTDS